MQSRPSHPEQQSGLKNFFIGIFNWFKNLFLCCFPGSHAEDDVEEVQSLLANEPSNIEQDSPPASPNNSSLAIILKLEEPITLSADESQRILEDAQNGENDYIDSLAPAKKNLAYKLIKDSVDQNIKNIDSSMGQLLALDGNANRLDTSWRRIKSDFVTGATSEYNIIPSCIKYQEKSTTREHFTLLDTIINCFQVCRNMLNLRLLKQRHIDEIKPPMPTKEQIEQENKRIESRLNAKTLAIVDTFNKRCEETPEEIEERKERQMRRKGGW